MEPFSYNWDNTNILIVNAGKYFLSNHVFQYINLFVMKKVEHYLNK